MYIPYIDLEIKLVILSKKSRVVLDIKEHGSLKAAVNYRNRYKCTLKETADYIRKVKGEMESAKSN